MEKMEKMEKMKKHYAVMAAAFFAASVYTANAQTAEELLRFVDTNEVFETIAYTGEMVIEYQNRRYVKIMKGWGRGTSDSFIEFTNQEDRGAKYLKTRGRLYAYSPDTEKVMLISGHMLKESMMGSDLSYEDTVNNDTLSDRYAPSLIGSEAFNGRDCWVLELIAKSRAESYPKQRLWIDKQYRDVLHSERFALSGVKLKEYTALKIEVFNSRRFPTQYELKDLLRQGSRTTFTMRDVILDKPIADSVFSQRSLGR
ncbi:MAG: outer membrane lipoprotein-sorting protein [Spirochaetaceae bacterium]|jgi:outer membrane lipoprotein-sorting protein|nr:outer membrane lipoprotein-sorting protein [Spirochaetaceae bacterium]